MRVAVEPAVVAERGSAFGRVAPPSGPKCSRSWFAVSEEFTRFGNTRKKETSTALASNTVLAPKFRYSTPELTLLSALDRELIGFARRVIEVSPLIL